MRVFALLAASALLSPVLGSVQSLNLEAASVSFDGGNPVRKVVKLLEEMKATVEQEAKDDQKSYDAYACWCITSEKAKTESVEAAEKKIDELTSFIEKSAGEIGVLKTEVAGLADDLAEDTEALETATALRKNENAEFVTEESNMKQTVSALTQALDVLSKVQLLQKKGNSRQVKPLLMQLQHIVKESHLHFKQVLQKDFWDVMSDMGVAEPTNNLLHKDALAQQPKSYNSRSGEIFGMLGGMKDEFEKNLASAQKEEKLALESFQKLDAAKSGEISTASDLKKSKESLLAETMQKKAVAQEDLEATKAALISDSSFLVNLKDSCKVQDEQYAARVKVRSDELVALGETLKILTEDQSRDNFAKTMTFIQVNQKNAGGKDAHVQTLLVAQKKAVQKAMKKILHVARKHGNWILASMAIRANMDEFEFVKESMDKMIAQLKKEQDEEYAKTEACRKEIAEAEDTIKIKTAEQSDLEEKKLGFSNTVETLTDEIEVMNSEVKEMQIALKQAGETRKNENLVFQQSISDQRATIVILNKALARLKEFYGTKTGESFSQQAPPPPTPGGYQKNEKSGGVLQLITSIVTEAEQGEIELKFDEDHSQAAYVKYVQDSASSIEAVRAAVVEKTKLLEVASAEKSDTEGSLLLLGEDLDKLGSMLRATHQQCDFAVKYFDIRQQMRQEEIDSIFEAKAILSGQEAPAVAEPAVEEAPAVAAAEPAPSSE